MDQIVAKADPQKAWTKAPEGSHGCVLVDVIDLGMHETSYMGASTGKKHKCALVWQIDEINPDTGKRFEMSREFTVSMHENAALRHFLGTWRGKSYSDQEAEEVGAPLHKLGSVPGLMSIEHKESKANPGRTYANVMSVTRLPKAMTPIKPDGYVRSEHWKDKIAKPQPIDGPSDADYPSDWDDTSDDSLAF
jgi:hypothetical protein